MYELPAGYEAVTGETILATQHNTPLEDLQSDANTARPVVAGGTGASSASAARANLAVPGLGTANAFTATQTWAKGADVASATALTLGDDGNYFDVTGTTTITSIATKGAGTLVKLHFDAALILTHHATDLVLPDGANITTAAGDEAEFFEYATGDWRCTNYQRAVTRTWEIIGDPIRTASAVPSVDIPDLGAYSRLRISGKLFTATDGVNVQVRTSTDNGSSFAASSGDYVQQITHSSGATNSPGTISGASGTGIYLVSVNALGNASNEALSFNIDIKDFNKAAYAFFHVDSFYIDSAGGVDFLSGGGTRSNASARNAIRFIASTGNIASMEYTVEGIRG